MSKILHPIVIGLSALMLCACSTAPQVVAAPVPQAPKLPPATALTPCPSSLATLDDTRPAEPSEIITLAIEWAGEYHACKARHDFLRGWVAGQAATPDPEPPKEPKRGIFGLF